MYVAKDGDGKVHLYDKKPYKDYVFAEWLTDDFSRMAIDVNKLPKSVNPSWDDPEPIEVKLVRKNK